MRRCTGFGLMVLMIGFQNCSKADFSSATAATTATPGLASSSSQDSQGSITQNQTQQTQQIQPAPQVQVGNGTIYAVDTACDSQATTAIYPPFVALQSISSIPGSCHNGFEVNNINGASVIVPISLTGGSGQLLIDVATYLAPDDIQIFAEVAGQSEHLILHTCRMQTWSQGDPTGGVSRPVDESIRQYHLTIPVQASALRLDFSGSTTPQYVRVAGLCNYSLTGVAYAGGVSAQNVRGF